MSWVGISWEILQNRPPKNGVPFAREKKYCQWFCLDNLPETSGNMVFTHIFRAFLGLFPVACPTKVCENGINDGLEPQLIRLWCEPTVKCKDSNNFRNVKCPFSDDPRNHLPSGYLAWLYAKSPFGKCRYFFKFNISYSSISMGHF